MPSLFDAAGILVPHRNRASRPAHRERQRDEMRASIRFLGVLEDIFRWAGQQRHELWLIYDVALADRAVYEAPEVLVVEPDGTSYSARWRPLDVFKSSARLVPEGLLELIARSGA